MDKRENERRSMLMLIDSALVNLERAKTSWQIMLIYAPELTPLIMIQMTMAALIAPILRLGLWIFKDKE